MISRDESNDHHVMTGSPTPGEPVFLAVGKLRRPHGVQGEILMEVMTDFPERLQPGVTVYLGPDHQPVRLQHCRWHHQALLIRLEGYVNREQVSPLRNQLITVRAETLPQLPVGEFYHHQILGLPVITDQGRSLGTLAEILETGANDVYLVRADDGAEILLPAIESVILDINLDQKQIRVHLLPGLLPD